MPYRTLDHRIDGVVITFADITAARRLEARLRLRPSPRKPRVRRRAPGPGKPRATPDRG
jgi:hypothetical protein